MSLNIVVPTVFAVGVLFHCAVSASSSPTPLQIVEKADYARMPQGDLELKVVVEDYRGDELSKKTTYKVWTSNGQKSLVDTLEPARQKGRKLLMLDEDLWFFTPDIKRAARVSFEQRLTGEVSNGDLSRTNFRQDYEATLIGNETLQGQEAWVLDLKAARKNVTYAAIKYWVSKKNFVPLKAEFFTRSGKILKTALYSGVKNVLGTNVVTEIVIEDAVQKKLRSQLFYSDHKKVKLDESFFNKDNITR
jgi:outer membrane lipoprotein-sorting protein